MAVDTSNLILVKLTEKFASRIFHEFHADHPHQTGKGGELLVTGGRVAQAARTPGVLGAIMQGVLEEVRDPKTQPTPDPIDVEDVVNGVVTPGAAQATDASAADASTSDAAADASADASAKAKGSK